MANYNDLITAIDSVIKTNNRREITGQLLQNVLNTMVGSLGENYQLAGFAIPTTNPHQPDQNVFYVASQAGVYTQFDNIVLGDGISFLMWKNGAWTSQTISIVTQSWVQQNYVSKEWFRKVFRVYDEDGLEIVPNDMDSVVDNIKAIVGLWTNEYLSALGMGRDGGGTTQTLAQLNDVQLGTLENGDALVYNTAIHKWENKQIQTGVDMSVVWAALAANTNEQINASHLATALSGYVTSANLSTMLNDYATKAWAAQNFITVEWFDKLFQLYNGTETEANKIAPNGTLPVDRTNLNIEAMFGFWTKKYISALGQGDDGSASYTTLAQLNDVTLTNPTANQILVYDGTHWRNQNQQSVYELPVATTTTLGGIKVGTTLAISSGVLNLPTTGVTAGTYKRVTVDAYGRVTSGDNTDIDTNTWRNIYVGGTSKVGTGIDTKAINFKAGSNVAISYVAAGTGSGQSGNANYFDVVISATDTTYSAATQTAAGLMSAADKKKLDGIAEGANKYSLPLAASGTRGGVQVGYTTDAANRNYAVQLSNEKMYVNVPWENTWRGIQNNLTSDSTTDSLSAAQGKALKGSITTLEGYFTSGVAKSAAKLTTVSKTAWGQTFWTSGGVPTSISGSLSSVINITMSGYIKIGDAYLSYDSTNNAIRVSANANGTGAVNFYAVGGVSALGETADGQAGVGDVTWALLADGTDTRQIALSHLTTSLTTITGGTTDSTNKKYAVYKNSSNQLFVDVPWTAGSGTVTSVKVGSTSYTPTNGVISLPAYPTSLPASDVYAWAKQSTKPTYAYSEITGTPTIPAAANNGTFSIKTLVGSTTTTISDFTANQSTADDFTLVQGDNVTFTLDTTNRKLTIKATNTTYSAGTGISLSGTTFSNSGVRAATINGNYLRINTNGTNADLTIPYATSAGSVAWSNVSSKPAATGGATTPVYWNGSGFTNCTAYSSASVNYASSSGSTPLMTIDNSIAYGRSGMQFAQTAGHVGTDPTKFQNPANDWYSHIIMNHGNSAGYYVDLAFCFHSDDFRFRRVQAGSGTSWGTFITSTNIGSQSVNYATSAGNADTVDGLHGSNLVRFFLSPMTSGAPADSAKSWFTGTMPSSSGAIVYNVPGSEKTIIAGKSSGSYGHMLQLNYDDNYLRLLRYQGGSWKSTDWEKISAGYADSAGSVAWTNVSSKPAATGGATTPVYWNGSGFTNCTAYSSASVNYATSAGKATNDSDGNAINSTYLKKSGGTMTGAIILSGGQSPSYNSTGKTKIGEFDHTGGMVIQLGSAASSASIDVVNYGWNKSLLTISNEGNLFVNGSYVQIGQIRLVYDSSNNAIKVIKSDGSNANLYATGGVSALGAGQESGGGGDVTWALLASPATGGRTIHSSYISSTLSNYLPLSGGTINGNVGIGTSSPTYKLSVEGSISATGEVYSDSLRTKVIELSFSTPYIDFHYNNSTADFTSRIIESSSGTLTCEANLRAYSYANTSDIRLKNKIKDVEIPLEIIARAPAFQFTWKNPKMGGGYHIGTSAQYWQSAVREFVDVEKDEMGTLSMQYGVAALVSTITVARKVMTHEEKIALLETRVSALEKENGEQEQLISSLQEELAKFKAA